VPSGAADAVRPPARFGTIIGMSPPRPQELAAANIAQACALTAGAFELAVAFSKQVPKAPRTPPWRRHTRRDRTAGLELQRALRRLLGPRRP